MQLKQFVHTIETEKKFIEKFDDIFHTMNDESITSFLSMPKTQYFLNKIKENKDNYQHIDAIIQAKIIDGNYQLVDMMLHDLS